MSNAWEQSETQVQDNYFADNSQGTLVVHESALPVHQPQTVKSPATTDDGGTGNIDKIRDILFGGHMRDYESRFQRLEQILLKESADLRESNRKTIERLESYFKQELEALQVRLKSERDERSGALSGVSKEMKDLHEALARRIAEVDDHATGAHHELREQLMQHGRDASDQLDRKHREAAALLEERFQELRKDKTDKAALASLFKEVAMRLTNEFQMPGVDR